MTFCSFLNMVDFMKAYMSAKVPKEADYKEDSFPPVFSLSRGLIVITGLVMPCPDRKSLLCHHLSVSG